MVFFQSFDMLADVHISLCNQFCRAFELHRDNILGLLTPINIDEKLCSTLDVNPLQLWKTLFHGLLPCSVYQNWAGHPVPTHSDFGEKNFFTLSHPFIRFRRIYMLSYACIHFYMFSYTFISFPTFSYTLLYTFICFYMLKNWLLTPHIILRHLEFT